MNKKIQKITSICLLGTMVLYTLPVAAFTKDETVYSNAKANGEKYKSIVTTHLGNTEEEEILKDHFPSIFKRIQESNKQNTTNTDFEKKINYQDIYRNIYHDIMEKESENGIVTRKNLSINGINCKKK